MVQITFDGTGRVLGAKIDTALLEKSRVTAIMPGERGFHIFFMICHYCEQGGQAVCPRSSAIAANLHAEGTA